MQLLSLALVAGLATAACRTIDSEPPPAEYPPVESASFGSMRNVSYTGMIWFGGHPGEGDLELAQRRGVRTVIDLTTAEEAPALDAQAICERLGIEYRHPAIESGGVPSDELVDDVVGELAEDPSEPRLVFCGSGGRCAMLIAIYRAALLDVPIDDALVEARRAGMRPQDEDYVRDQVARVRGEPAPVRAVPTEDGGELPAGESSQEAPPSAPNASASDAESAKQPFVGVAPAHQRARSDSSAAGA